MSIIRVHDKEFGPYLGEELIDEKIQAIADAMNRDYAEKKPLFISIPNGAFMFASDLFKKITIEAEISFIKLASYKGTKSSGQVITAIGLDTDLHGRHVVIVEDIVDIQAPIDIFYGTLDQVVVAYNIRALKAIRDVSIHGIRGVNHDISKRYALIVAKFLQ